MSSNFVSRWYQTEACTSVIDAIKTAGCNPIAVVPTGAGKTHIAALIIDKYLDDNPLKQVIVLSHVKEILEQNYDAIKDYLSRPLGLYSAMLNSRTIEQVTVAGIQSIYSKPELFNDVGLIIVDECHLVTDTNDGMYRQFLATFNANVVGLTATPFRSRGFLHQLENRLFTTICYDLSERDHYKRLIEEGYLCKLYSKGTLLKMDTKGIRTQAGDFSNKDLDKKFNTEAVTEAALDETIKIGGRYKKWLIFAISIDHAEAIREYLNEQGINTGIVHSEMDEDRDQMLDRFRSGFYRAMVNVNVLTTGLDIPNIDLIVMLRPTKSAVIYVQSVGRGLRVHPDKSHCLVLDFAGNVARHGPIDNIDIRNKGKSGKGEPVTKECPVCMAINHAGNQYCEACNHKFVFKVKIEKTASELNILGQAEKTWVNVNSMDIYRHKKPNKPDSVRIDYLCGLRKYSQWAAVQSNSDYAAHNARYVISQFVDDIPHDFSYTVSNILAIKDKFKKPTRIYVDKSEKYPRIEKIEFDEDYS